jgi:hypothetical protein
MSQSSLYFSTSELESEYNIPTPKTPPHSPESTCDIRLKVQTLYLHTGWSKDDIALQSNLTPTQSSTQYDTVLHLKRLGLGVDSC